MNALALVARFNLRQQRGRSEWRGDCPACGYCGAFVLTARETKPLLWCASCQDRDAMTALLRGTMPALPQPAPTRRAADPAARTARAIALWEGASPALGTPADEYLTVARRLPGLAASDMLRFRAATPHPGGGSLPAMLALVVNAAGRPAAVHRTFLQQDGSGKAAVEPAKASLGAISGGAIRLDPLAPELVIAEGVETAASAGRLLGLPAWAAISAGNLATGLVLPAEVRAVLIAADPDGPGERAARTAAARWKSEGRKVRIARPDAVDQDFNDLLRARAEVRNA